MKTLTAGRPFLTIDGIRHAWSDVAVSTHRLPGGFRWRMVLDGVAADEITRRIPGLRSGRPAPSVMRRVLSYLQRTYSRPTGRYASFLIVGIDLITVAPKHIVLTGRCSLLVIVDGTGTPHVRAHV